MGNFTTWCAPFSICMRDLKIVATPKIYLLCSSLTGKKGTMHLPWLGSIVEMCSMGFDFQQGYCFFLYLSLNFLSPCWLHRILSVLCLGLSMRATKSCLALKVRSSILVAL